MGTQCLEKLGRDEGYMDVEGEKADRGGPSTGSQVRVHGAGVWPGVADSFGCRMGGPGR